jgi:hypothetical protein
MNIQAITDRLDTLNASQTAQYYCIAIDDTTMAIRAQKPGQDYFVMALPSSPSAGQLLEALQTLEVLQSLALGATQ